jgi:hypothetical protein
MSEEVISLRPWVQVAAFCQTAISEATGTLSIIKIRDGLTLVGATKEMQPTPVQLTMVLVLKSGEMVGQYNLKVRCNTPSQVQTTGPDLPCYFEGGDRGVQAVLPMGMIANEPGIYWFDILLVDQILTRLPLRVMYQVVQMDGYPGIDGPVNPMGPQTQ